MPPPFPGNPRYSERGHPSFADFNLLKFPDKDQALEKILDLTLLSDVLPTGFHDCVTAVVDKFRREGE